METILIIILSVLTIGFLFLLIDLRIKKLRDSQQDNYIKDFQNKLELLYSELKEIKGNVNGSSKAMYEQISSFAKGTIQIQENLKLVQEQMKNISSFQDIFRSPKLRGEWGEASLKHILSEYFPPEFYEIQHKFKSGERVDAVLKLPDGKLLPIDAKFSSDNFERMISEKDEKEKEIFRKKFLNDIKFNIDKISSKYILPSENTVDYAIMYIPAEAIFHEILFNLKDENIGEYARKKKVIITSPNTIYLALRTIEYWFRDVQLSEETKEIINSLAKIQLDAQKLAEEFKKLGNHLRLAQNSYDNSEKRLFLFSEKVKNLTKPKVSKKLPK